MSSWKSKSTCICNDLQSEFRIIINILKIGSDSRGLHNRDLWFNCPLKRKKNCYASIPQIWSQSACKPHSPSYDIFYASESFSRHNKCIKLLRKLTCTLQILNFIVVMCKCVCWKTKGHLNTLLNLCSSTSMDQRNRQETGKSLGGLMISKMRMYEGLGWLLVALGRSGTFKRWSLLEGGAPLRGGAYWKEVRSLELCPCEGAIVTPALPCSSFVSHHELDGLPPTHVFSDVLFCHRSKSKEPTDNGFKLPEKLWEKIKWIYLRYLVTVSRSPLTEVTSFIDELI